MDTLKTAVSSVSVLMIMLGVVMMLVPEGKMQKPLKTFAKQKIFPHFLPFTARERLYIMIFAKKNLLIHMP